jgi:hypothetical protein
MIQPGEGAVVLDVSGYAWQRIGQLWLLVSSDIALGWQELEDNHGPITVLHEWSWNE